MAVWKRNQKGPWQIEFQCPGYGRGRFSISSGTKTKASAESYRKDLVTLYTKGEFEVLDRVKDKTLSLADLKKQMDNGGLRGVLGYVKELERQLHDEASALPMLLDQFLADPSRTARESTFANYRVQIGWLVNWLETKVNGVAPAEGKVRKGPGRRRERISTKHLTTENVSEWLRTVETKPSDRFADKRGRRPNTVNHHRAAVSAWCSWMVTRGILKENPCLESYRAQVVERDAVYLNRKQWPIFREFSIRYDEGRIMRWERDPKQDPARPYPCTLYWEFLAATGATTYNEGCVVQMSNIFLDESPASPSVRVWLGGTKTENRPRDVYISRSLAERMRDYAEQYSRPHFEPVFPWGKNEAFYVWTCIKKSLLAAGHTWIKPVRPYDLRHTYAVTMVQGDPERNLPGVDLVTLMNLMGHKEITTTMIYAKHVGDYARRGCMILHEVLGL
jgi:integrase